MRDTQKGKFVVFRLSWKPPWCKKSPFSFDAPRLHFIVQKQPPNVSGIHPYATLSVCNAFCLFQENPSFFVLGQKGRRRRRCSYCCMWRLENRNRETHVSRNHSLFLEENKQRRKRCALKIRSSYGYMLGR